MLNSVRPLVLAGKGLSKVDTRQIKAINKYLSAANDVELKGGVLSGTNVWFESAATMRKAQARSPLSEISHTS